VLFAYLIWRAGPSKLWQNLVKLGWGFIWVLALTGVSHIARAWAWRLTLEDYKDKISFPRLLGLRLGAEAAGQLGIVGQTVGDSIRVSQLSPEIPRANGLASVTLDRGLYIATGIIVLIAGLVAALPMLWHSRVLRLYASLSVFVLIVFLLATLLAVAKRWPVISGSARFFARVSFLKNWIENRFVLIESVENTLLDFHHNATRAFWASFLLNLASHCMAVAEVCLILWLMGVKFGVFSALVVEAMTKMLNVVGTINPGNFGTFEGGNMLIGKMFGLTGATGLALGLVSRLQAFFYGLLPQAAPELTSYAIYRWECAIRSSVVLGFVGAGGLGQEMDSSLKMLAGNEVATMLLVFIALVALADGLSAWLRRSLR